MACEGGSQLPGDDRRAVSRSELMTRLRSRRGPRGEGRWVVGRRRVLVRSVPGTKSPPHAASRSRVWVTWRPRAASWPVVVLKLTLATPIKNEHGRRVQLESDRGYPEPAVCGFRPHCRLRAAIGDIRRNPCTCCRGDRVWGDLAQSGAFATWISRPGHTLVEALHHDERLSVETMSLYWLRGDGRYNGTGRSAPVAVGGKRDNE